MKKDGQKTNLSIPQNINTQDRHLQSDINFDINEEENKKRIYSSNLGANSIISQIKKKNSIHFSKQSSATMVSGFKNKVYSPEVNVNA